jgi:hypothetical protein
MKKTILTLAMAVGCVAASYGQGTVLFATTANAGTKVSTNSVVGGPATGLISATPATYYFALFYSQTGSTSVGGKATATVGGTTGYAFSDSANWSFVFSGVSTALGKFSGAQNSDGSVTVPVAAAGTAELVAIGWSANIGSSISDLQAFLNGTDNGVTTGWVGQSAVASIIMGNAPGTSGSQSPVSLFGTGAGQVGGMVLGEVVTTPEPTSLALAAMGGLSLLALRRKKA